MKSHFQILFTFISLLLIRESFAQSFNAGISGGLTVSEINGANSDPNRRGFHKLGVTVGGVVNARIAKNTLLQFEINYIQKGSMQPPDSLNNGYYKIALGYVEIPILIRQQVFFNWKGKRVNKVDLEFGASYGKMLQRTVIGSSNYQLNNTAEYYNTDDISLLAGVDYNFTNNICFNFRYSNSLIPAIKRTAFRPGLVTTRTINRGNNMVFQFGFKFLFSTKRKGSGTPVETVTPTVPE